MAAPKITNISQLTVYLNALETRLDRLEYENESLREEMNQAKMENAQLRQTVAQAAGEFDGSGDTTGEERNRRNLLRFLPDTGLLSRSFLTRAFAVWGHYFVAQFIIGLGVLVVYLVVVFVVIAALGGR